MYNRAVVWNDEVTQTEWLEMPRVCRPLPPMVFCDIRYFRLKVQDRPFFVTLKAEIRAENWHFLEGAVAEG
ncbi:MAG: hypothetical protein OXG24_02270, partial [Gammaproteobacteria bacterium]|nr:hypothetical protein [Gammaproteobacteria bacterium]